MVNFYLTKAIFTYVYLRYHQFAFAIDNACYTMVTNNCKDEVYQKDIPQINRNVQKVYDTAYAFYLQSTYVFLQKAT